MLLLLLLVSEVWLMSCLSFTFYLWDILSSCFYIWLLLVESFVYWLWVKGERTKSRSLQCYCCWCKRWERGIEVQKSFSNVWRSVSVKYCVSFMYFMFPWGTMSSLQTDALTEGSVLVFSVNVSFILLVLPQFVLRAAPSLVNVCIKLEWEWSVCALSLTEGETDTCCFLFFLFITVAQDNEFLICCTLGNWFLPSTCFMCLWLAIGSVPITSVTHSTFNEKFRNSQWELMRKEREQRDAESCLLSLIPVYKVLQGISVTNPHFSHR